jgi:lipid-A-disaccharide synthase
MKYFLIAGELSGDQHATFLINRIKKEDVNAEFEFWGGDAMAELTGKKPLKHVKELSIMGFTQVISSLPTLLKNFKLIKAQISAYNPDVVVFIDFPGFNLRLAPWAKNMNFITWYFISPAVWAWKSGRKEIIRKYIDRMMVIFPFEEDWYKKNNIKVEYVGNPTYELLKDYKATPDFLYTHNINKPVIVLIPGSRRQEINRLLPIMLQAVKKYTEDYEIVIAAVNHIERTEYKQICERFQYKTKIIAGQTYALMKNAKYGLITSGTATLEAAVLNLPHLICYKTSVLNYFIASRFVKLKWIGLPNIICGKSLVDEYIQSNCTSAQLSDGLSRLMSTDIYDSWYQELHKTFESANKG